MNNDLLRTCCLVFALLISIKNIEYSNDSLYSQSFSATRYRNHYGTYTPYRPSNGTVRPWFGLYVVGSESAVQKPHVASRDYPGTGDSSKSILVRAFNKANQVGRGMNESYRI